MLNHNDAMQIGLTRPVPDALAFEYKRDYGTARRNLDITDLVNNPAANGECRVLGLGLTEQGADLLRREIGSIFQYSTDATLIAQDGPESLPK